MNVRAWVPAACTVVLALLCAGAGAGQSAAQPSLGQPAISPDGRTIAFISGGKIWSVPAGGGSAQVLVDDGATDERPLYSPDGRRLAYISSKTGNGDVYVLTLGTGTVTRMTYDDGYDQLESWSPDGAWIFFSNSSHNIYGAHDIYRVRASGGTPLPVVAEPYMNVYFSSVSPDGRSLVFNARGVAGSQWWRKGHSHLDDCEVWIRRGMGASGSYERVTAGEAKDEWPMWRADGRHVVFMSDRSGAQNLWEQAASSQATQLTHFSTGRVVWPSMQHDGRSIVFERNFGIWRYDFASARAARVPIRLLGNIEEPQTEHRTLTDRFSDYAISPDGKKVAFIAQGRLFAAAAVDGGSAFTVPLNGEYATAVAWSTDSNRIAYVAGHGHEGYLYTYDFLHDRSERLTTAPADIHHPRFDPAAGGDRIAFERNAREVAVVDAATKTVRVVAHTVLPWTPFDQDRPLEWSPGGRWLAFFTAEVNGFTNVHVVDAEHPRERPISFLANVFTNAISWDPHGKFVLFDTGQRTEPSRIARVDLVPRTPTFEEQQFRDLFKPSGATEPQKPAAPPGIHQTNAAEASKPGEHAPVRIDFGGIRERLAFLPTGLDSNGMQLSPDGKTIVISATVADQTNLYLFPLKPEGAGTPPVARQLTHSAGQKNLPQWSPDGKRIYYLDENGALNAVNAQTGKDESPSIRAELNVDWNRDKVEAFTQAWSAIRDFYADPHTNGVNWNAVRSEYLPRIRGAQSPDEFRRLLEMMIGELNSSHTGAYPPTPAKRVTGHLGLDFDRAEYERTGRLRITAVIPQSPADVSARIHPGDVLRAVDGTPVGAGVNLDALLENRIGKRVVLSIDSASGARDVPVKPVNYASAMTLRYRAWVEANRAEVARLSGGRLGYVHMPDMSAQALENLYKDLDTTDYDKQGVVVDVRSNEGGFVNAYAIDVFARRPYLRMKPRNMPWVSARVELGQRALERPTVLVVNSETLSDGEDFTQAYRALHVGKVVGVPTAGWIIYTSAIRLVDGTTFRLPFERVMTLAGAPMEMHPRPVDVYVRRPVGSATDPQLATAVRTLLSQLR